jgi:hypothetical protein
MLSDTMIVTHLADGGSIFPARYLDHVKFGAGSSLRALL